MWRRWPGTVSGSGGGLVEYSCSNTSHCCCVAAVLAPAPSSSASSGGGMSKATIAGIVTPLVVIIVVLVTVVGVYVIRHRRLQHSFMSFASSHYSSHTGRTTFSGEGLSTSPVILQS